MEPLVAGSKEMNLDKLIGFGEAAGSGAFLAMISSLNYETSLI
jgi:hypothetical protein